MPTVSLPDGTEIEFPYSMSEQEIETVVRGMMEPSSQGQSGIDPQTGRPNTMVGPEYFINQEVLPEMESGNRPQQEYSFTTSPVADWIADKLSSPIAQQFSHGAQMTGAGIGQKARQLANALGLYPDENMQQYNQDIQYEQQLMQPLRQQTGVPGVIAEGVGGAMPILPVGGSNVPATLTGRLGQAAGLGAVGALTQPTEGKAPLKEAIQQGVTGAVIGPVAQGGFEAAGKVIGPVVGKVAKMFKQSGKPVIDASGEATAEFSAVLEQQGVKWSELSEAAKNFIREQDVTGMPKNVPPKVMAAQADYQALKMPATKGQLLRDRDQIGFEQSMAGTPYGREIGDVYDTQNLRMIESIQDLQQRTGVQSPKKYDVGENVSKTVQGHLGEVQAKKITPKYDQITAEHGDTQFVPLKFQAQIDDLFSQGAESGLKKLKWIQGMLNSNRKKLMNPDQLKALEGSGMGGALMDVKGAPVTVQQADNMRKVISELAENSPDLTEQKFYRELVDLLDDDVATNLGSDVYAPARKLAKTEKLDFLDSRTVDRAFRGEGGNERWFETSVINKNIQTDELKQFFQLMNRAGEKGNQTKRQVQALTLEYLMDEATSNVGKNVAGDAKFSVSKFKKALDRLGGKELGGGNTKLEIIFGDDPEIIRMLSTMLRVGERNVPVKLAPTGSDTATKLSIMFDAFSKIPGLGMILNTGRKLLLDAKLGAQARAVEKALPGNALNTISKEAGRQFKDKINKGLQTGITGARPSMISAIMQQQNQ